MNKPPSLFMSIYKVATANLKKRRKREWNSPYKSLKNHRKLRKMSNGCNQIITGFAHIIVKKSNEFTREWLRTKKMKFYNIIGQIFHTILEKGDKLANISIAQGLIKGIWRDMETLGPFGSLWPDNRTCYCCPYDFICTLSTKAISSISTIIVVIISFQSWKLFLHEQVWTPWIVAYKMVMGRND